MSVRIEATDFRGIGHVVNVDIFADECPICHVHVKPIPIGTFLNGDGAQSSCLQMVYRCPNANCGKVFVARYRGVSQGGRMTGDCWYFYEKSEPVYPTSPSVPETIRKLSPSFVAIYSQANAADQLGLKEICGAGYRKALEFLVKDFANSANPKEEEGIAKSKLSSCIEKYIQDPMAKSVAKLAAWLGNDETHYYRKWEDKDLSDLKKLLHMTINAIDNQMLAQKYEKEMKE